MVLVRDTVLRDIQRPAPFALLLADNVFLASHSKADLGQVAQKWNVCLMRHGFRLKLNKTEFFTTDPHETREMSDLNMRVNQIASCISANWMAIYNWCCL